MGVHTIATQHAAAVKIQATFRAYAVRKKVIQRVRDEYTRILAEIEGADSVALLCWPRAGPCAPLLSAQELDTLQDPTTSPRAELRTQELDADAQPSQEQEVPSVLVSPTEISSQTPAQLPIQAPTQAPAQVPVQVPAQVFAQPAQAPAQVPAQASVLAHAPPVLSSVAEPNVDRSKPDEKRFPPRSGPNFPEAEAILPEAESSAPDPEATLRAIKEARRAHLEEELRWALRAIKNRKEHLKLMKRMKKSNF
eukprot:Phypoly_transcript_14976.p1 GENE.Phypoly_transcript_14976~~Phypoly_transcript_14976.p1  ORF type:complete len:252 (-),score=62.76 Phypoly_transcript_14976:22-777(-)